MQHTLVAVFDNRSDAQNAMNELLSSNFSRQDVRLSNADPTGMTDSVTGSSEPYINDGTGDGIGASIKHFFTDLFGADNSDHASRYEGAVTRGHHVLTVTADSLPEVERAADIVERYGPTDIDEQASGAGSTGTGAMSAGAMGMPGASDSMRMGGAGSMQQSGQAALQSDSVLANQLDNAGDRKLFAQQSLNQAEPMGQTYQEPMGKSGLSATGGTSFQGSTLQENSVQGSALEGTQSTDVSFDSSAQQGGTIRGSALEGSVQQGAMSSGGMGGIPGGAVDSLQGSSTAGSTGSASMGSPSLGSQQRDTAMQTGATGYDTTRSGATQAIPVVEEQLKVGKREVQRGGVRIYSRVVETPVNERVELREEHVDVQRRPVNQPLGAGDASAFKEQSIEMRESAEEAVVEKSARIVEEVTVGKRVDERQQQISDTVRHTEVDVQRLDAGTSALSDTRDDDSTFRNHFTSNYGSSGESYDDYAPAYSYGSQMARSQMYRNQPWDDIEGDMRKGWDSRIGGGGSTGSTAGGAGAAVGGAWEKMKSAVRHGWESVTRDDDDDSEYRSHWNATYSTSTDAGSYDDYKPAYSYGTEMARNEKYRGRQWGEVESDLRTDWDARYAGGGQSTWEKMKSAVRHGWDRVTS